MTTPLTFAELRLANMLTPPKDTNIGFTAELDLAHENDLESALVEMVLVADRLAAGAGIDLAAAIRARFDPATKGCSRPSSREGDQHDNRHQ